MNRSESRKQFAWEDDRSRSRGRSSSSSSRKKRISRYSPPTRRNGNQRSDSNQNRRRYRSRSRRSYSRSRSRGRGRSRSRSCSRSRGGKGAGKQSLLCLAFVRGKCHRGDKCTFDHPSDKEECRRRLDVIAQQPCKMGSRCTHPDCLFTHPGEEPRRRRRSRSLSGEGFRSRSRSRERSKPKMKAVGWKSFEGIQVPEDLRLPKPAIDPTSKDLLVRLHSTDMNPVNLKKSEGSTDLVSYDLTGRGANRVLAYSSAGVIEELSEDARCSGKFKAGDEVWFADICDPANDFLQEYRLIDYRVASLKPKALSFDDAGSIPVAALTAWGGMIRHMQMDTDLLGGGVRLPRFTSESKGVFLVLPGGCPVGSFALQFARRYLNRSNNLTVVASASKPESVEWCKKMGADYVINHDAFDIKEELQKNGIKGLDYVFCGISPAQHEQNLYAVMKPLGQITGYHGASFEKIEACLPERISLHRERVGLKDKFLEADGEVLTKVARLFDDPSVGFKSLVTQRFPELNAEAMRKAYTWHSLRSSDRDAIGNAVFQIE